MSNETPAAQPGEGTANAQVEAIFAWRRGFNAMYLIDLGIELGLFRAFAATPGANAEAIAGRLGLHSPYVETWCLTAYAFELLEADEARGYRLAPYINEILASPGHPRYLGGYVQLGTRFAADDFRFSEVAMRTGAVSPFQGRSDAFAQLVGQAIAGVNQMVARKILPGLAGLAEKLHAGADLLEVGCGTGNLQLQIAKAFPKVRLTGIDIDPTGLAAARAAIEQAGLAARVNIVAGDVATAVPQAGFDAVVMVEVLHEIARPIRPAVIRACAAALRPRGWLVIVDETYPTTLAQARTPEFRFPVQTGFEEMTWGNIIPTKEEQDRLLEGAGFRMPYDRSIIGAGFTVLAAQK